MNNNGRLELICSKDSVFLFELHYSLLEVGIVGLAPIARVLSGDTVTVGTSFFSFF